MEATQYSDIVARLNATNYKIRAGVVLVAGTPEKYSVLLVKGKTFDGVAGRWGFPKGMRQEDETDVRQTAFRELAEETGICHEDLAGAHVHPRVIVHIRESVREMLCLILVVIPNKTRVTTQRTEIERYMWTNTIPTAASTPARQMLQALQNEKNRLFG